MDKRLVGVRTLRKSKVAFALLFACLLIIGFSQEKFVGASVDQIPRKDQERISYFFKHAIFWDSYGYVLLGNKPCAITSYNKITWNPLTWVEYFSPHNLKMKKGWDTWRKYEHLFPHPKFIFLEDDSCLTAAHFIILVQRQAFLQMVRANKADFQSVLQIENGEELLVNDSNHPFLSQSLRNHDGLIGTILGYGRNNAWAFHERAKRLGSFLNEEEQTQMKNFCEKQGFWKFFTGNYCREFCHLSLPGFAADLNDPETQELREKYLKVRADIITRYDNNDFLRTTLNLLCESHSFP